MHVCLRRRLRRCGGPARNKQMHRTGLRGGTSSPLHPPRILCCSCALRSRVQSVVFVTSTSSRVRSAAISFLSACVDARSIASVAPSTVAWPLGSGATAVSCRGSGCSTIATGQRLHKGSAGKRSRPRHRGRAACTNPDGSRPPVRSRRSRSRRAGRSPVALPGA